MLEMSKLSLNIITHITILFTILTLIFMFYISKLTTEHINHKISNLIISNLKKILYTHDSNISLNILNIDNTSMNNISSLLNAQLQNTINENIANDETLKELVSTNNELKNKLANITNSSVKKTIKSKIDTNNSEISINIKNILSKFNYSYYINIFDKPEYYRTTVNTNLFSNIKFINILLVIFLIFFITISIFTETLFLSEIGSILMENLITFIFVGIIEVLFFKFVASKFIPAPPSILFSSLLDSMKAYLKSRII